MSQAFANMYSTVWDMRACAALNVRGLSALHHWSSYIATVGLAVAVRLLLCLIAVAKQWIKSFPQHPLQIGGLNTSDKEVCSQLWSRCWSCPTLTVVCSELCAGGCSRVCVLHVPHVCVL